MTIKAQRAAVLNSPGRQPYCPDVDASIERLTHSVLDSALYRETECVLDRKSLTRCNPMPWEQDDYHSASILTPADVYDVCLFPSQVGSVRMSKSPV